MDYRRVQKQIEKRPEKLQKFKRFNVPIKRKFGKTTHLCRHCGKRSGVIRKYGLVYCRQCFREQAEKLGFKKYS